MEGPIIDDANQVQLETKAVLESTFVLQDSNTTFDIMLSMWDTHGFPSITGPIDVTTFVSYVLPPIVCYFVVAVLVVVPQTHAARVALWPIVALLALRALVSVSTLLGKPGQEIFNTSLVYYMFCIVIRTFDWTLAKEPLVRHIRPANSTPSTIADALDLVTNLRGHGWNWSHGLYIPHETRPTSNHMAFAFSVFLSAVAHAFVCGVSHRAILSFSGVISITEQTTIIDESLSFLVRYLRAGIISTFAAIVAYTSMQMGYDLLTLPAVLFLGQDPAQWPPSFDAPWRSTSLHEFWGRRWHQWNRRALLLLGGYPLSIFLGQTGIVLGAFLASAVLHDFVLLSINSQVELWRMLVGFGMMGPGILAERAFHKLKGKRVGGVLGWLWMMGWLLPLGSVMVEGCARVGVFGNSTLIDKALPTLRVVVERLVMKFDGWLHTI